jgi:hypothetical protein
MVSLLREFIAEAIAANTKAGRPAAQQLISPEKPAESGNGKRKKGKSKKLRLNDVEEASGAGSIAGYASPNWVGENPDVKTWK